MMSTFPRGQRARANALAVTLRFLLAVVFAISLSYGSVAIEETRALLTSSVINHHR